MVGAHDFLIEIYITQFLISLIYFLKYINYLFEFKSYLDCA